MHFFAVKSDQLSILHDFGISVGDFLIEDDAVLGKGTFVSFGLGSDFIDGL